VGKLVLFMADGTMRDIVLSKERIVIGRRADNDVCLPYPAVSGEHASVVTILADSFLEDLGSTNGTLVNGKAIVKHFLRDHDQIDIGRQRLVYLSDDLAKVDALPPDIARSQLLGLTDRVPPARPLPNIAVPPLEPVRREPAVPRMPVMANLDEDGLRPAASPPAPRAGARAAGTGRDESRVMPTSRDADQRIAAWAADWAAPSGVTGKGAIDTTHDSSAIDAPATPAPPEVTPPAPKVRVLSGASLGRAVAFDKDELSVGRVGVQVAVVRKVGEGFLLVPVEGPEPPRINGAPVPPDGAALHPGDTFEVAGVRLELSLSR
jgi:hypothetical protein